MPIVKWAGDFEGGISQELKKLVYQLFCIAHIYFTIICYILETKKCLTYVVFKIIGSNIYNRAKNGLGVKI